MTRVMCCECGREYTTGIVSVIKEYDDPRGWPMMIFECPTCGEEVKSHILGLS